MKSSDRKLELRNAVMELAGKKFLERMERAPLASKAFVERAALTAGEALADRGEVSLAELDALASCLVSACFVAVLCGDAPPSKGALRDAADAAVNVAVAGV